MVIGSFLNVVIDRLPTGQSLAFPPSHCPSCQRRLAMFDLIPVFSYLRLKGRCRACASPIPARIFWIELTTGLAFGLLYLHLGLTPELGVALFYYCLLVAIAIIDIEQGLILNQLVYPGIILAFCVSLFSSGNDIVTVFLFVILSVDIGLILSIPILLKFTTIIKQNNTIILAIALLCFWLLLVAAVIGYWQPSIHISNTITLTSFSFVPTIVKAAIGGGTGFVLFLLIILLSHGGMGIGDIKMASFIGIMLGFPYILVGIFLAIVIGGLVAVGLLVTRVKGRKQTMPFGPFLAVGAFIALLWGPIFLDWYLRFFSGH
jgi:leader peptidase (prepilin peptidase) / N-methyltransferase